MEWLETLNDVNYYAVVAAVVASFVVGMVWYSKAVFGNAWMKELGLKDKDVQDKEGMMRSMLMSAVASFIAATTLAALLLGTGTTGAADGAVFGGIVGFGIAMSSMVTHDVFSKTSSMLTRINGLHDIVKFAVIGAILGGWM